ncbi:hypothetical protein IZ6_05440 [Terrihabitans soli]|uniref:Uncharacterized protein n=1 Tax=Terrihabitans soli TaxID=708113 RepID=A0A6S6QLP2_9HYPH|nr:SGNH hydrolase domain-containing protein [Terrihabitans soli]BCJ89809.1 hypothetical protein IZ6_05440 [Terrihabitans soli]
MRTLNFLLAILVLTLGLAAGVSPSHAQFFEPRYSPPGGNAPRVYRLPGTGGGGEEGSRRQYVPEQRTRPRQSFFDRLFGRPVRPPPTAGTSRPDGLGGQSVDNDQAAPAAPKVAKTIFVAVMGDSLAENLAPGLNDALSERPEVGLVREIRSGAGLLKESKTSWRQTTDEILARQPQVAAAVIFIGPMDDAPAPVKKKAEVETTGPTIATTAPWQDDYANKVDEIALAFRQKGIPLLWVGLPPVEDPKTTAEYLQLNELVRQRVAALGGTFIDVWEGFVNEDEEFTVQGPNIEGRVVRLRTADGLHFTKAGARKIGHAVELELRTILAPKDQGDAMSDIGVDPGAPTVPGSSRILMLGMTPRTPGAILVPPAPPPAPDKTKKPEFNPGVIAGPEGAAPDPSAAAAKPAQPPVSEDALVTGAAIPAKPGRADDFAWPATAAN